MSTRVKVAIGIILGLAALAAYKQRDRFYGKTPVILAQFAEAKTVSENRVQELKAKQINGRREYEKAQVAVNKCIAYLEGVLDQPDLTDEAEIDDQLKKATDACDDFRNWADKQLAAPDGQTGAVSINLADCLSAILKDVQSKDEKRREAVKKALDEYRFRSWSDIPAGTGAVK